MTSRFVDEYAPPEFPGYPCASIPNWSNQAVRVSSGDRHVNQRWENPLYDFMLPGVTRRMEHFNVIYEHWLAMRGDAHSWPFRDPLDFASVRLVKPNVVPTISALDVELEPIGDSTTEFQLSKVYTRGAQEYRRPIYLPVISTLRVAIDGAEPLAAAWTIDVNYTVGMSASAFGQNYLCIQANFSTTGNNPLHTDFWAPGGGPWSVSRPGGVITFDEAPTDGNSPPTFKTVTAGFLFDCEVCFESSDVFSGILKNWGVPGVGDLMLLGVPHCTDGE